MNLDEQKKLYEEGNHICVYNPLKLGLQHKPSWRVADNFSYKGEYQLIHKKHAHILEAFLEGCEVYNFEGFILGCPPWNLVDFINDYNECHEYIAMPKSLENCYCEANELHFNRLTEKYLWDHPTDSAEERKQHFSDYVMLIINEECEVLDASLPSWVPLNHYDKIEYNTQLLNWIYCPKETKYEFSSNQTKNSKEQEQLEAEVQNNSINNFKEYGFAADFAGEILQKSDEDEYIGLVYLYQNGETNGVKNMPTKVANLWDSSGISDYQHSIYDLTPIVPEPVYPIFKKNKATGYIHKFTSDMSTVLVLGPSDIIGSEEQDVDISDIDEFATDISYDSARGLYHGQPVWVHFIEDASMIYFYNADKDLFHTVGGHLGDFISPCKVEPIPLETLKTLPFIWEQYQTLIGE